MRIDDIGYNHSHDAEFCINRPDGAGDWLLILIKTKAIFQIDGVEQNVKPNSFILYTPDYPQFYRADGDNYTDDWCHFTPDSEERQLMQELQFPLNQVIDIQDITDISVIIRNMCYEFYSLNPHRKKSVDLYFHLILLKLSERTTYAQPPANLTKSVYFDKLLWIRECIHRNPGENWSIDKLAADISLSRSRFQHLYTQVFGVNILQDIINVRMFYARQLLHNTDLPIHTIATLCGYHNSAYFMRRFKEKTGMTPSTYRSTDIPLK